MKFLERLAILFIGMMGGMALACLIQSWDRPDAPMSSPYIAVVACLIGLVNLFIGIIWWVREVRRIRNELVEIELKRQAEEEHAQVDR